VAFTAISNLASNHRARLWKCTGDNSATSLTVPTDNGYVPRGNDTAVSFALNTPTVFTEYPSNRGGLNSPQGGTAQVVTSTTVNADGTLTVVFTAAPGNGEVVYGVTAYDKARVRI
jgi:hypothetical protein